MHVTETSLAFPPWMNWGIVPFVALTMASAVMTLVWALALRRQARELNRKDRHLHQLMSAVSHELRTPLSFITGFASILQDELAGPLNAEQHRHMGKILLGADQLTSLINQLLDYTRLESGQFQLYPSMVDAPDVIRKALENLEPIARQKRIELRISAADADPVLIDPERLTQILYNLASNAIKFTPPHGMVEVLTRTHLDVLEIEVRDTGIGIPAEDLTQVFTAYYRTVAGARMSQGTGLGLAITRSMIEAQGGTIQATSQPGKGTTFRIRIPVS
jgi:signal transduction histidine kinase